ncbi:MAG: zinc ribbon domain-containing protein [Armatimonadetes bacterium]|nr:zinc ribbon domain-containing protein [Armatimonadota bacterium]MCA1996042.1 zinc ribbon domain-containing protein [Armatimonadota bacterium]
MTVCIHCGKEVREGRYCSQCGWPLVQHCPACGAEMPLIASAARCPSCHRVLKPCPQNGCGRAIRPEDRDCPCPNRLLAEPVVRPWLDLRGDGSGHKLALWTAPKDAPPKEQVTVRSRGQLIWAGLCNDAWCLATKETIATESGLNLRIQGGISSAVASSDGSVYVRNRQGVWRFDGQSATCVLPGDWNWVRTWGATVCVASDREVRFVEPDGSADWSVEAPGAVRLLWETPEEAVIVSQSRLWVVERSSRAVRTLDDGGSDCTVLWRGRVFTPIDGMARVHSLGDPRPQLIPSLDGLTPRSAIVVYGSSASPRIAYLTDTDVRSGDGRSTCRTLAQTFKQSVEGWTLAYRAESDPMVVLSRRSLQGFVVELAEDLGASLPRVVAENAGGPIWLGFCLRGLFAIRKTPEQLELVTLG